MNHRFTPKAQAILRHAKAFAEELGHTYIGSEHLLLALLEEGDTVPQRFLTSKGLTRDGVKDAVISLEGTGVPDAVSVRDMTPRLKHIIEKSKAEAGKRALGAIDAEQLLLALLEEEESIAIRLIRMLGCSVSEMKSELLISLDRPPHPTSPTHRSEHSALSAYSRNLTAQAIAGKLDPVIGRETETNRLIRILCRRQKNNPCLIGEPGVGKTAVVEGLANRIVRQEVPDLLIGRSLLALDLSSMIAGAKYRGEFEERLRNVMTEISKNPDLILFIDELHTIVGAGAAEGAMDAANILKPLLSRGEVRVIGATTLAEYRKYIEKDHALERRFQPILVEEPSAETAFSILQGLRASYEGHHGILLPDQTLRAAIRLSERYLCDRRLPDKAIDLIDEAASAIRVMQNTQPPSVRNSEEILKDISKQKEIAIRNQEFEKAAQLRKEETRALENYARKKAEWELEIAKQSTVVTEEDVATLITEITGIPLTELTGEDGEKLKTLEGFLNREVIGQKEAAGALARAVVRGRLGLQDAMRPLGTFLFTGPTGVGKTEMAKALARHLFGTEDALLRLDMSEYMERHSVSRLIGSPPGYVGYEEGGILTDAVRRRPYSVVLFDEIEKAHPDIMGILLQITEEGVLTDSQGNKTDFKSTVVILTSNVDSSSAHRTSGFLRNEEEEKHTLQQSALRQYFRPELLGRMDDIILFRPLTEEDLFLIAEKFLAAFQMRARAQGFLIHLEKSVAEAAIASCDKKLGARPLRRVIRKLAEDALASAILSGTIERNIPYRAIHREGKTEFIRCEEP